MGSQFQLLFTYKTRTLSSTRWCSDIIQVRRKRLNYCITYLFRTMCTKFYQNRLGFVEDMTENILMCFFGSQYST